MHCRTGSGADSKLVIFYHVQLAQLVPAVTELGKSDVGHEISDIGKGTGFDTGTDRNGLAQDLGGWGVEGEASVDAHAKGCLENNAVGGDSHG